MRLGDIPHIDVGDEAKIFAALHKPPPIIMSWEIFATTRLLEDAPPDDFDAVFYPVVHTPMWNLAKDI